MYTLKVKKSHVTKCSVTRTSHTWQNHVSPQRPLNSSSESELTPLCCPWEEHGHTFQEQIHGFEETEVTRLLSSFLGVFSQALRILLAWPHSWTMFRQTIKLVRSHCTFTLLKTQVCVHLRAVETFFWTSESNKACIICLQSFKVVMWLISEVSLVKRKDKEREKKDYEHLMKFFI